MNKEDIINYVMTTPGNPNRAVLNGMLDGISGTQLPSPTESDNGKVLGVDGGEYKLVEQSGGATPSIIKIMENVRLEYNSTTGNCSGGAALYNGASLSDLIGDKSIIGFEGEVTGLSQPMMVAITCIGDGGTINPIIHRSDALSLTGARVLVNSNDTLNGQMLTVYAICI